MRALPRVCIVGPLIGANAGYVTTQGEKLTEMLRAADYSVIAVSSSRNRYIRLAEITSALVRHRREIDVMVVFTYGLWSFVVEDIATLLASQFRIPIVLNLCGGALPDFIARFPRWTGRVFGRADKIVCQSEYLALVMRDLGHHPEIIRNVIDLAGYPHKCRRSVRPKLFWMRTFEDLYNPEMPLRVLARVQERHPDALLVMAGQDNGLQAVIQRRAHQMGLATSIRFPGFLDLAGKREEAAASDIFLNTPRIDNRPICVVEAAALGLPVVTTNVGGIPHLVEHERTALLVSDDDDQAMANAVLRLVNEPALAERLSINGRQLAEQSSMGVVRPSWEQILTGLATSRPRGS